MDKRTSWLVLALIVACSTGCCRGNRGLGLGLLGNVNSARIAPPGTGTLQIPQVANAPNNYYNPQNNGLNPAAPRGNTLGWRPAGTPLSAVNPTQQPFVQNRNLVSTSHRVAMAQPNSANLQVVTGTSTLTRQPHRPVAQPQGPSRAQGPSGVPLTATRSQPILNGMPVNDASRASAPRQIINRNLMGTSLEYTARPQIRQVPYSQPMPNRQPNYNPYAYATANPQGGLPPNGNAYQVPTQGANQLSVGWRQRQAR